MGKKSYDVGVVTLTTRRNAVAGFDLRREPTGREASHILRDILWLPLAGRERFGSAKEHDAYRKGCREALSLWLRGLAGWPHLCRAAGCEDDILMGFPMPRAFQLAQYLGDRGVIARKAPGRRAKDDEPLEPGEALRIAREFIGNVMRDFDPVSRIAAAHAGPLELLAMLGETASLCDKLSEALSVGIEQEKSAKTEKPGEDVVQEESRAD